MEQVIARRKTSLGVGFIAIIVVGLALGVLCVVMGISTDTVGAIYVGVAVGLILIAAGIWQTVVFFKTPKNLIVYRDGVLYLGNQGACSPLDVTQCKVIVTRRNGIVDKWGKLEIGLSDGRKFVLNYVDEVEAAQQRLGALKERCYDEYVKQANQSAQAEQPAQETKPQEDPFGL